MYVQVNDRHSKLSVFMDNINLNHWNSTLKSYVINVG